MILQSIRKNSDIQTDLIVNRRGLMFTYMIYFFLSRFNQSLQASEESNKTSDTRLWWERYLSRYWSAVLYLYMQTRICRQRNSLQTVRKARYNLSLSHWPSISCCGFEKSFYEQTEAMARSLNIIPKLTWVTVVISLLPHEKLREKWS